MLGLITTFITKMWGGLLSWPCFQNPTPIKLSSILIVENIPQQKVPLSNKSTTCQHLHINEIKTKCSPNCQQASLMAYSCQSVAILANQEAADPEVVATAYRWVGYEIHFNGVTRFMFVGRGIVWFKHHWIQTSWTCSVVSFLVPWKPRIYRWERLLLVASLFFSFDLSIDQNTEIMTKLQKNISRMYWHQIDLLQFNWLQSTTLWWPD